MNQNSKKKDSAKPKKKLPLVNKQKLLRKSPSRRAASGRGNGKQTKTLKNGRTPLRKVSEAIRRKRQIITFRAGYREGFKAGFEQGLQDGVKFI